MKMTRAAAKLALQWEKLPPDERERFQRQIDVAVLAKGIRMVPDEVLGHLAAPGTPTAEKRAAARAKLEGGALPTKRRRGKGPN